MVDWAVRVESSEGDVLVPERMGTKVYSLSTETAFKGVKIFVPCDRRQIENWKNWIGYADRIFIKRLGDDGTVEEAWLLKVRTIYDLPLNKEGDFLFFGVEGSFNLV